MKVAILQTARGGSKSVPNKNVMKIGGIPVFLHNIINAKKSKYNIPMYISTDIPGIEQYTEEYKVHLIHRPEYLCGDDASHHDVIVHGLSEIEKKEKQNIDVLIILLGNTITAWNEVIDSSIEMMEDNSVDSVITVGKYNMFNPMRSLFIDQDGFLKSIIKRSSLEKFIVNDNYNDKGVVGDVYYLNGSLMAVRRSAILNKSKALPFSWLGDNVVPIVQKPTCMEIDALWQVGIISEVARNNSLARFD